MNRHVALTLVEIMLFDVMTPVNLLVRMLFIACDPIVIEPYKLQITCIHLTTVLFVACKYLDHAPTCGHVTLYYLHEFQ